MDGPREKDTMFDNTVKIAVIDLNNGVPNQGVRCLRDLLTQAGRSVLLGGNIGVPFVSLLDSGPADLLVVGPRGDVDVVFDFFDARRSGELPGLGYDIFISSGGPGSPYDGQGLAWEKNYFNLLDRIYAHNQNGNPQKKYVFFICHSFQMMVRFFGLAEVVERHSKSFGIFPVHKTDAGNADPLLQGLADPFYGSDFRNWQAIQPNHRQLRRLGAKILCIEKIRPHVPFERAIMAIRVSREMVGTQFHPEADPASIRWHLFHPAKKDHIIERWGMTKYRQMLRLAADADAVARTQRIIIPGFLDAAFSALRPKHEVPAA